MGSVPRDEMYTLKATLNKNLFQTHKWIENVSHSDQHTYSCSGKHLFHIQAHLATTKVNNLNHMHTYTFINTQYFVKERWKHL